MRKITIEDISRDTGLSRGTVSRALNDRPDISLETKQKVLESCRRLNYVPSYAARSLATGRNYALVAVVSDLDSTLTATLLRGATQRAASSGYVVHVVEAGRGNDEERIAAISAERVDGVLNFASLSASAARRLHRMFETAPVASCREIEGHTCDLVRPDDLEAGRMVARFLIRNGRRRPLCVQATGVGGRLLEGVYEVCEQGGIDAMEGAVTISDPTAVDALAPRLEQADAVIASDDFLAISVMIVCERLGRRVGDDIAIVGFGNESAAQRVSPGLTSVDFDGEQVGRRAVEAIVQRLGQKEVPPPQTVQVAPRLVRRASTRCCTQDA